ncbi:hypothetical protein GF371_03690, partial [Candidatus Woesearchaeota archaeon]|nr:hypothetical protein [Candidatus Woesearchaeota archaeon]
MEDIAQYALDLCKDVDYADIRVENLKETSFLLKTGIPEIATFDKVKGLGLRIVVNGSMGFASTNNLEKPNIKQLVSHAIRVARTSKRLIKNPIRFSDENINIANYSVKPKRDPENLGADEKL